MKALIFDIGSTFTKGVAYDLDKGEIIGKAKHPSTVNEDVNIGLSKVIDEIKVQTGYDIRDFEIKRATSSAAGGLKIVAIGLVPDLTAEAAKKAALSAGGKVLKVYAYELTKADLEEISSLKPDIIILSGGTDGGNRYYPLINAKKLSTLPLNVPFIYAGNKDLRDEIEKIFKGSNKEIYITENVMPEYGVINIDKVQELIREIFLRNIIHAKGLDKVKEIIEGVVMPTPLAVLKGLEVFADIYGESLLVDVGGATTDVCSVAEGAPTQAGVVWKGLKDPRVKRSVEGDLGVRVSALSLLEVVDEKELKRFLDTSRINPKEKAYFLTKNTGFIPKDNEDLYFDAVLAYFAVKISVERHVGHIEVVYTPMGTLYFQYGKDLREVKNLLFTGGPLIYNPHKKMIIKGAVYSKDEPFVLKPVSSEIFIDKEYILFSIGVISEIDKEKAKELIYRYVEKMGDYYGFEEQKMGS
ncbi:methylaspartate mutase accessory protein GlmL [Dictyoglomus thermophilum]|uniref:Glutamate mutase, MutL n=1 Tax=Dictyoglomus thermophilum (strain ATCC 35947 / DSM 3960 / H-6-12) TaxID=309799 RepID=B5YEV2_DICT6|nr:methylaspartate mutase accessory protein GlmL [Dictyoglomus thermophilum]ACI19211.1 glutamate mutase, MutL [Dictyoglomus thermophilum H-6-12]